jgi:hypothetical protein
MLMATPIFTKWPLSHTSKRAAYFFLLERGGKMNSRSAHFFFAWSHVRLHKPALPFVTVEWQGTSAASRRFSRKGQLAHKTRPSRRLD